MDEKPPLDTILVELHEKGKRLDILLKDRFHKFSRTYFQHLIESGLVLINGEIAKKRTLLDVGDEIEIEFALTPEISLEAENIPLDILYEDETMLAVNKPAGLVVHPGAGNFSHTFVNALLYHCQELDAKKSLRPGIVHRLDKDTSGVLIAAKTEEMHQKLVSLFSEREILKEYLAVCVGHPGDRIIEGNIGRHPTKRKEMTVLKEGGKSAFTTCKTLHKGSILSVVRLTPKTGRTHQLRVHLASIGTPILGDIVYGNLSMNKKYNISRQLLHAEKLSFTHPLTQEKIELKAPVPEDMQKIIDQICAS